VSAQLSPVVAILILLVWPVAKSLVYFAAATISIYSSDESRRAAACRVMRIINHSPDDLDD
jgi:hypothetical protein